MNNQDNYKKAVDQIHASDELKEKAFENAKYAAKSKKYNALKYLSACAAVIAVCIVGVNQLNLGINDDNSNVVALPLVSAMYIPIKPKLPIKIILTIVPKSINVLCLERRVCPKIETNDINITSIIILSKIGIVAWNINSNILTNKTVIEAIHIGKLTQ